MSVGSISTLRCLICHENLQVAGDTRPATDITLRAVLFALRVMNASSILWNVPESDSHLWLLPHSSTYTGMCCNEGNRWQRASSSHAPVHIEHQSWALWVHYSSGVWFFSMCRRYDDHPPFFYCSRRSHRVQTSCMEEVLYLKWVTAHFPSNIVAVIRTLICLSSGTQFGNGWFVSYGRCWEASMLQLGLADLYRDREMWLDRWKIRKCFLGEKTDSHPYPNPPPP